MQQQNEAHQRQQNEERERHRREMAEMRELERQRASASSFYQLMPMPVQFVYPPMFVRGGGGGGYEPDNSDDNYCRQPAHFQPGRRARGQTSGRCA
jgi:hypothetical protein